MADSANHIGMEFTVGTLRNPDPEFLRGARPEGEGFYLRSGGIYNCSIRVPFEAKEKDSRREIVSGDIHYEPYDDGAGKHRVQIALVVDGVSDEREICILTDEGASITAVKTNIHFDTDKASEPEVVCDITMQVKPYRSFSNVRSREELVNERHGIARFSLSPAIAMV